MRIGTSGALVPYFQYYQASRSIACPLTRIHNVIANWKQIVIQEIYEEHKPLDMNTSRISGRDYKVFHSGTVCHILPPPSLSGSLSAGKF